MIQTEQTPNPDTLKFIPGKKVSAIGPFEFTGQKQSDNKLIRKTFLKYSEKDSRIKYVISKKRNNISK